MYKYIENIVAKGEVASFEQFLLLPQCFKMTSAAKSSMCGKGFINTLPDTDELASVCSRRPFKALLEKCHW